MLGQFKLHDIKDCMYVEESLKQMKKIASYNWNRIINFRFDFLWLCFIKFFGIMKMPENCQKGPFLWAQSYFFLKISLFVLVIFWTFDITTIPKHNYVEWIHIRNVSGWVYVTTILQCNTAHLLHCSVNSKGCLSLKSSFHDCKQNKS